MIRQQIRLLVSDIDGTLLNEDGAISGNNMAAIRRLERHGIGFTLATGRMDRMMRTFVSQLDVRLPVIACNGAVIRDCSDDRILWRRDLPPNDALDLICWLRDSNHDFMCYSPDQVYYPAHSRHINHFHRYNQQALNQGMDTIPLIPLEGREIEVVDRGLIKILAVPNGAESLAAIRREVAGRPSLDGVASMSNAYDIMTAGVSKGDGLIRLAGLLHLDPCQVAAVGDNDNDADMLRTAGFGIAMANGTSVARAAAEAVTVSDHNQSGLAEAIDLLLEKIIRN